MRQNIQDYHKKHLLKHGYSRHNWNLCSKQGAGYLLVNDGLLGYGSPGRPEPHTLALRSVLNSYQRRIDSYSSWRLRKMRKHYSWHEELIQLLGTNHTFGWKRFIDKPHTGGRLLHSSNLTSTTRYTYLSNLYW